MRFYNQQHRFYGGVDLHARTLSLCVLDAAGHAVLQQTLPANPTAFLNAIAPFREGLAVACECMFAWYWLADLCEQEKIPFVLGHALYMKAIHGGKAKTDPIDTYDQHIRAVELYLTRAAKVDDPQAYARLRSVPGVGPVLALVLLYEIHDVRRFPEVGQFLSYARLVRCVHESAGKKQGTGGNKIGNAHLKWAFSEATCLLLRESEQAKRWLARREKKHGKARALGALAARLGRAVFHLLRKGEVFDGKRFFAS